MPLSNIRSEGKTENKGQIKSYKNIYIRRFEKQIKEGEEFKRKPYNYRPEREQRWSCLKG